MRFINRQNKSLEVSIIFNLFFHMNIYQEITTSIQKLKNHWERTEQSSHGVSRIDKDILIQDLRQLYDLVFEIEIGHARPAKAVDNVAPSYEMPKPETESVPLIQTPPSDLQKNEVAQLEEETILPNENPQQNPQEIEFEIVEPKELITEDTNEIRETLPEELTVEKDKVETQNPELVKEPEPLADQPTNTISQEKESPQSKIPISTSDKFQAGKTLADIYQNNGDNSFAAKFGKNKITDIKSAIGINDKFLFINEIFNGNSQNYSQAIESINHFELYHEALAFVEKVREENKVDNQDALGKLLEIIKRKFH